MTTVLSIDVGIVNLGICQYEKGGVIKKWDVITLCKTNVVKSLRKELNEFIGEDKSIEKVIIEKQPSRNVKMRTIEGMIEMYFEMRDMKTIKYSAKYKLKNQSMNMKGKHNYRERKRLSIEVVKKIVEKGDAQWKKKYLESKKKDDLADALLQAMSYVEDEIPNIESGTEYTNKIVSRKPSKNQEKKGYSINNVKYFMTNFSIEECKKDVKITKAVINYFKTWEKASKILL